MEHKELKHFKDVLKRFEELIAKVPNTNDMGALSAIEREGVMCMRELQVCSPRLWNDFIKAVREHRTEINNNAFDPVSYARSTQLSLESQETPIPPNQAEVYIAEPKPRKKKGKKEMVYGSLAHSIASELTKKEEEELDELRGLLSKASNKFDNKTIIDNSSGKSYRAKYSMIFTPIPDKLFYGVAFVIENDEEEISFINNDIQKCLDDYEAVDDASRKPKKVNKTKKGK